MYLLQWSRRGVCELLDDGPRCVGERRLNLDSTTSSSSSSSDHHVEQWKSELSLALPPLYSKHLLTSFISSVSQLFVERVSNATFVRLFNPSFPSLPFARASSSLPLVPLFSSYQSLYESVDLPPCPSSVSPESLERILQSRRSQLNSCGDPFKRPSQESSKLVESGTVKALVSRGAPIYLRIYLPS